MPKLFWPTVRKNCSSDQEKLLKFEAEFFFNFFQFSLSENLWHQICVQESCLMRIDNPYLVGKMFKNLSLDSVRSCRTCPAHLGVRSCPVRKSICPVRSSPTLYFLKWSNGEVPKMGKFRYSRSCFKIDFMFLRTIFW